MTRSERDDFWQRVYVQIDRYRESGAECDVAVNKFEVRRWDLKFTARREGESPASVMLVVSEHAPSRDEFLLAVTPTFTVEDVASEGDRELIPVFLDSAADRFLLHADHGPVDESQIPEYFAQRATELLNTL
jgi:hypothetical protein